MNPNMLYILSDPSSCGSMLHPGQRSQFGLKSGGRGSGEKNQFFQANLRKFRFVGAISQKISIF